MCCMLQAAFRPNRFNIQPECINECHRTEPKPQSEKFSLLFFGELNFRCLSGYTLSGQMSYAQSAKRFFFVFCFSFSVQSVFAANNQ